LVRIGTNSASFPAAKIQSAAGSCIADAATVCNTWGRIEIELGTRIKTVQAKKFPRAKILRISARVSLTDRLGTGW